MKRAFFFALLVVACSPEDAPTPTGPPQNVPSSPGGPSVPTGDLITKIELCSVEVTFNYTAHTVTFKNGNDQISRVTVHRPADDTQLVSNYLAWKGEDSEDAKFAVGDRVKVKVEFLDPNLSLNQWAECDEKTYDLGI